MMRDSEGAKTMKNLEKTKRIPMSYAVVLQVIISYGMATESLRGSGEGLRGILKGITGRWEARLLPSIDETDICT